MLKEIPIIGTQLIAMKIEICAVSKRKGSLVDVTKTTQLPYLSTIA